MDKTSTRRNTSIVIAVIVVVILLLLTRCVPKQTTPSGSGTVPASPAGATESSAPAAREPPTKEPDEVLGAATLKAPSRVTAGNKLSVDWTGPANRGDFVTIVKKGAPKESSGTYALTDRGTPLELTTPIDPGTYELRYVTGRSRTVLATSLLDVDPAGATVAAPSEVGMGRSFSATWTGPNNKGDYITIVAASAPDSHYGSYVETEKGSPVTLTAPVETGVAEVRYVLGQGRKVIARTSIRVIGADATISAPSEATAGSSVEVTWTGPNNSGDYITVVTPETPEGRYGNYTQTSQGSPLKLLLPIMAGKAELRYITGQGDKVLARRTITIVAAVVRLTAPPECKAESEVSIDWSGPNNPGDYITIVARSAPEGQYGHYLNTSAGSPLRVRAPKDAGEAEVRYIAAQGNKILARIPIKVTP